jgi:hypothetical protein
VGRGNFVNQKLGKNVSRKGGLLKSELTAQKKSKAPVLPLSSRAPKNELTLKKS